MKKIFQIILLLLSVVYATDSASQLKVENGNIGIGDLTSNIKGRNNIVLNGFNAMHWEYGKSMLHIQLANYSKVLFGTNRQVYFYNPTTKTYNDLCVAYLMTTNNPPRVDTPDIYDDDPHYSLNKVMSLTPVKSVDEGKKLSAISNENQPFSFDGKEMAKIMPDVVQTDENGATLYDPNALMAYLVSSLQSLTETVAENGATLAALVQETKNIQVRESLMELLEYDNSVVTLKINADADSDIRVLFSDTFGNVSYTHRVTPGINQLLISDCKEGIYILTLVINGKPYNSIRVVKQQK